MKKILMVLALVAIITTGTAFADHPNGLGIGVVGNYSSWGFGGQGGGISLKIPNIPIYWAISLGLGMDYFALGVTGDYYLIDNKLGDLLHWFFGVGGYFTFFNYSLKYLTVDYSYTWMYGGVRAPIGISFQPMPLLEIFADIAPSIGLGIYSGYEYKVLGYTYKDDGGVSLGWGAPLEIGIRLWF
jgi:hypothetical protein